MIRKRHILSATMILSSTSGGCTDYKDLGFDEETGSVTVEEASTTGTSTTTGELPSGATTSTGELPSSTSTSTGEQPSGTSTSTGEPSAASGGATASASTTEEEPEDTDGASRGDEGDESSLIPEDCSEEAISECYDSAFDACEEPEDVCDAVFACDLMGSACDPTSWDEYEDWEQLVLYPLTSYSDESCGERLQACMFVARIYCELTPDVCATYVEDCHGVYEFCIDEGIYETGPEDCTLAETMCRKTEQSICEARPEQCEIVSDGCDRVAPLCD